MEYGKEYFWVIEALQGGELIGYLSSRRQAGSADLGFVIHPQHWGRGFATEAARGLLSELGKLNELERVIAYCDVRNTASAAVLKKAGLTYKGDAKAFIPCAIDPAQRYDASFFCLDIANS